MLPDLVPPRDKAGRRGWPATGWLLLVLLLLLAGPLTSRGQTEPPAQERGAELPVQETVVVGVRVECRESVDAPGLIRLVSLAPGDPWTEARRRLAHQHLEATGMFLRIEVDPVPVPEGVEVVLRLVRKPVLLRYSFGGDRPVPLRELRRLARLQEGAAFDAEARLLTEERLQRGLQDEGFPDARITTRMWERRPGELEVRFDVTAGLPRRITRVVVTGADALPRKPLLKAAAVADDSRIRRTTIREAEKGIVRHLRGLGYAHAEARVEWEEGPGRRGPLRVTVEPGPLVEVVFEGNRRLSNRRLRELLDLTKRVVVTDGTWREYARRIRRAYREAGYAEAKVRMESVDEEDGARRHITFRIEEGIRFRVAPVEFEGREGISRRRLRKTMATAPPSWLPWRQGAFVQEDLEADAERIRQVYHHQGYLDAEVVDQKVELDPEKAEVRVVVHLVEGVQRRIESVEWVGFPEDAPAPSSKVVRPGLPLDEEILEAERIRLARELGAAAYYDARVEVERREAPPGSGQVQVRFVADPGVRAKLGRLIIQGNFDTRRGVVRREFRLRRGDALEDDVLRRAQSGLYRLGLFRSVGVEVEDPRTEDPAVRDVLVTLAERPPLGFQFGAGYNTRDGFRGFTEIAHANVRGRGQRIGLRGELALNPSDGAIPNEYLADLSLREPRLLDSPWNLRLNLIAQRATRSVDQYSFERLAVVPAVERTILRGLQFGFDLQFERANLFDLKPDVKEFNPRDEGRLLTTSFGPYLLYEGRDDPFSPTTGVFDSVRLRFAPVEGMSDVPFVKLQAQHSHYVPLGAGVSVVYAGRLGWARAFGSRSVVPLRERFFLGGRSTVRGFAENAIGPQGAPILDPFGNLVSSGGNPLGGDFVLNLNTELRFPLLFGLTGVTFVDAGGVYLQDRRWLIEDFRRAAGLGLLYMTPVGPIAVHYGFKLDRRSDERIGEFHFSIGAMF